MKLIDYFKSPISEFAQIIFGFVFGLLFGPLSYGMSYNFLFIIIYEIVLFYFTQNFSSTTKIETRIICNISALYGWILGRSLFLEETGLEDLTFYLNTH